MSDIINGSEIASRVLNSTGGAYAKRLFKLDTVSFAWLDSFLKDRAIRNKIKALQEEIRKTMLSPVNKDELLKMFEAALASIKNDRLAWFMNMLKSSQDRQGAMVSSNTLIARQYIPPADLTKKDIDAIFSMLPEGVKQADIDSRVESIRGEIRQLEKVIAEELSPPGRWVYRDDGKPLPYPQGCRWTQYVTAWEKIAPRYDGPVSVEGSAIESESEMTAYAALGLGKIAKTHPLRRPGN